MNFKVVPRLSYISALSVSASLYFHEPRIRRSNLSFNTLTASENVEALPLPQNLKKEVLCLFQPVGEEIKDFLVYFWSLLKGHCNYHEKLSWTYLGTIDYGKSAGSFVSSGEWNNLQSFKLACGGSDPENILRLWPIVRKDAQKEISKIYRLRPGQVSLIPYRLRYWFWVNHFSEHPTDVTKLKQAVLNNNLGAARYFLADRPMHQIFYLANEYMMNLSWVKFDPTTFFSW